MSIFKRSKSKASTKDGTDPHPHPPKHDTSPPPLPDKPQGHKNNGSPDFRRDGSGSANSNSNGNGINAQQKEKEEMLRNQPQPGMVGSEGMLGAGLGAERNGGLKRALSRGKRDGDGGVRDKLIGEPQIVYTTYSGAPTSPLPNAALNSPSSGRYPPMRSHRSTSPSAPLPPHSTTFQLSHPSLPHLAYLPTRFPSHLRSMPLSNSNPTLTHQPSTLTLSLSSTLTPASTGQWVGVGMHHGAKGDQLGVSRLEKGRGFMAFEKGLVLGLEEVLGVVEDCSKELLQRGLRTPLLFSPNAIPFSPTSLQSLLQTYLTTLHPFPSNIPISPSQLRETDQYRFWTESLRLAGEHEVAWALMWGLGKVVRVQGRGPFGAAEERGLLDWERYEDWRGRERASNYESTFFPTLYTSMPPTLVTLLQSLFNLFTQFTANCAHSGLTPSTLSSLFGPVLFGLGPASCDFETAHSAYVRASGATEHLLLAHIRNEKATHDRLKGDFPSRLNDWIAGYPSVIITDRELDQGLPRRGVKVKRLEKARRTVRAYSKDLLAACQEWPTEMGRNGVARWEVWEKVVPPRRAQARRGPRVTEDIPLPHLTPTQKKRLNLDHDTIPLPNRSHERAESSPPSGIEARAPMSPPTKGSMSKAEESKPNGQYGSLADQTWSDFQGFGFGGGLSKDKLEFNLYEGAKKEILQPERHQPISWHEFAGPGGGFDTSTDALSKSLTLSPPAVVQSIQHWPEERDAMHKKLKKDHKEGVPFAWDTTPLVVNAPGAVVEELFLDVWTEYLYGGGWTDYEELTFRDANWVLVEYALSSEVGKGKGDKVESRAFLFEEVVPGEYQTQLAIGPKPKKAGGLFSRSKTVKGRSPAQAPLHNMTREEAEFDAILRKQIQTKQISLSKPLEGAARGSTLAAPKPIHGSFLPLRSSSANKVDELRNADGSGGNPSYGLPASKAGKGLFKRRATEDAKRVQPQNAPGDELDNLEMRTASGPSSGESDPDSSGLKANTSPKVAGEKWVDILVSNGATRMEVAHTKLGSGAVIDRDPSFRRVSPRPPGSDVSHTASNVYQTDTTPSDDTLRQDTNSLRPSAQSNRSSNTSSRTTMPQSSDGHGDPKFAGPVSGDRDHSDPQADSGRHRPVERVPMQLEDNDDLRPLPVLGQPIKLDSRRDTVASVISGYGHSRNDSSDTAFPGMSPGPLRHELPPPPRRSSEDSRYPKSSLESQRSTVESHASRPESSALPNLLAYQHPARPYSEGPRQSTATDYSEAGSYHEELEAQAQRAYPRDTRYSDDGVEDIRDSVIEDDFEFQPPPKLEDIEAIARRDSPGRIEHGMPLHPLDEGDEEGSDVSQHLPNRRPLRTR